MTNIYIHQTMRFSDAAVLAMKHGCTLSLDSRDHVHFQPYQNVKEEKLARFKEAIRQLRENT